MKTRNKVVLVGICLVMLFSMTVGASDVPPTVPDEVVNPEDVGYKLEPVLQSATVDGPDTKRVIHVLADLNVVDANYLVGVSPNIINASARDTQGNEYRPNNDVTFSPFYRTLATRKVINPDCPPWEAQEPGCESFIEVLQPFEIGMDMDVDPNGGIPTVLSELSWTNNVLLARYTCQVDIPFIAGDYWYELASGSLLHIDIADSTNGEYTYMMTLESEGEPSLTLGSRVISNSRIPNIFMTGPQLLGRDGQPIKVSSVSGGVGGSSSGGTMIYHLSGRGTCLNNCTVSTVRFILARDLYEATATFTLTDIPVPTP